MDFIQLLQLAENKGYIHSEQILNENGFVGYPSENEKFIELCLIQKWLRDTHKIHVAVFPVLIANSQFNWSVQAANPYYKKGEVNTSLTYESALLQGINAALQLI